MNPVTRTSITTVDVGDLTVAYRQGGTPGGRPVVLVHGLAEDSGSWRPQLDALQDVHAFAYDLRGHGSTTLGHPEGTLAQLDTDLTAFLEIVTGPAICVGFSLGGTVVLSAAASRPDLVAGAVVLGTSTVVGRAALTFYADRIARADSGDRDSVREALREDTAAGLHGPRDDLDDVVAARVEAIGQGAGYANAARAMVALHEAPLTARLADITCSVVVVGGEHDAFCPRKAADIICAALPEAVYVEIPAVGHLMNVDNPAAVTAALAEALKGMS